MRKSFLRSYRKIRKIVEENPGVTKTELIGLVEKKCKVPRWKASDWINKAEKGGVIAVVLSEWPSKKQRGPKPKRYIVVRKWDSGR